MKNKRIKKLKEFKEGGYYSYVYFSPQGSPSYPRHFFIIKITDGGNVVTKTASGDGEDYPLSKLQENLSLDYVMYSFSNKKDFVKELKATISEKKKKSKLILRDVANLKEYIAKLPV